MKKSKPIKLGARATAALVLNKIFNRQISLQQQQASIDSHTEASFIQALCYGVLRQHHRLQALSQQLLNKPFKAKYSELQCLLEIGLFELQQAQTPEYACVSEIVKAAKQLNKTWAGAVLNRCLRDFIRHQESLLLENDCIAPYANWWLDAWQQDWPDAWQQIVTASQQQAPLILRVNPNQVSMVEFQTALDQQQLTFTTAPQAPQAIICDHAMAVTGLPGYQQGWFSVQDITAQLAAPLLSLAPGARVLDACAAPGGKTTHLFECQPKLAKLIALDNHPARLEMVKENCQRLKVPADCVVADAADVPAWWDNEKFDAILLDAPCSGSGVMRRHPDIAYCRSQAMINTQSQTQIQLLQSCWQTLKAGGQLLYVTCSVLRQENDAVIQSFLQDEDAATLVPLNLPWGRKTEFGWQCLPGDANGDGFYFSLLTRTAD